MLVTSRPGPDSDDGWGRLRLDHERCLELSVAPLSLAEVSEMAGLRGLTLSKAATERLFRHTSGHPLYVRTLLTELSPEQLASSDGPLPVPRSLALATVARLLELPESARDLAGALAVMNQRTSLQVAARVAEIPDPSRALDSLLVTGFVDTGERRAKRLGPGSPPLPGRHLRPPGSQAGAGRCTGLPRRCSVAASPWPTRWQRRTHSTTALPRNWKRPRSRSSLAVISIRRGDPCCHLLSSLRRPSRRKAG